ncbi:FAD-binding oxidoreductase [Halalkalibacter oceani]|uniref:FAD-binding oxidoreductase n=1 Tax=Halalkalibacter oceani TaxID=1653776 RepID=A0A9X2IS37_9BACI|nr:FAD-binding oxidoreductase [Halalkalibacter oceani]MCM3716153.1 FAD-binding oxidoreductase [Halalkalibacter oceani]
MKSKDQQRLRFVVVICCAIAMYGLAFSLSLYRNHTGDELLIHDVSRLFPERVEDIIKGREEEALVKAVRQAKEDHLKISIAGARHSQGGHAFYRDSLLLDMTDFDEILSIDPERKLMTVQSGVTWAEVQNALNRYGLAVKVMQSSNIFTIGGSLSSNVHGRDPRYGPLIDTVESFRLLTAEGEIKNVSRSENKELFELVIGGFGLFGVILDVTLEVTDNELYAGTTEKLDYEEYPAYIEKHIKDAEDVGLHFARLSATPGSLFEDMYVTTYRTLAPDDERYPDSTQLEELSLLQEETHVRRDKFFLGLARNFDWGKRLVWDLQQRLYANEDAVEIVSRNNAMRPPVAFLEYDSDNNTDILQEYFVPTAQFPRFVGELKEIIEEEELNVLNVTVRYTPKHAEGFLRYSNEDTLALVLLINHSLSDEGIEQVRAATQRVVEAVLACQGTYYLTYQSFPTQEQIRAAYPEIDAFFAEKRKYDPEERFMNHFYEEYRRDES